MGVKSITSLPCVKCGRNTYNMELGISKYHHVHKACFQVYKNIARKAIKGK
jgi:hypothetical protein